MSKMRLVSILSALALTACDDRAAALPACETLVAFTEASSALEAADERITRGDFAEANEGLRQAIDRLGDQYAERLPSETNDDTGLLLPGAMSAERNGDIRQASEMRKHILRSRLEVYRQFSCGS